MLADKEKVSTERLKELRDECFASTTYHLYKKPLQLLKGSGCYVYDERGEKYLDCIGGIVCISSGHNHPTIKRKLIDMLESNEIQHTSMLYLNPYVTQLAQKILEKTPEKVSKISFTNSGSEANEMALLTARQATGETTVINLRQSYHGNTAGALSLCGNHKWRFRCQPSSSTTSAAVPNCYRCPFGKKRESCNLECAQDVEETIQTASHGKIAAFIAEPILGVGGCIDPPDEYYQTVIKIVHQYGGKYISDEVQTGIGRTGNDFFLTKTLGIDADMITMAKGLGNGAAIGAVAMTDELSASLSGKLHFNTFGGDPYQSAQALVNIEVIEEEELIKNADQMGHYLKKELENLSKYHPLIGDVRGRRLLLGIELVKDRKTKEHATEETDTLLEICRDRGLLIGKSGLYGNVIRLAPPLSISKTEINFVVKVIDEALHYTSSKHCYSRRS